MWQLVDRAGHSSDPRAVLAAMIAVCSGDTLKASDLPNRLFDHNPKLRKGAIADDILRFTPISSLL